MLSAVHVQGFQSIRDLNLEGLGKLTVISGPSNTGKSALVRAVRAAVSNPAGTYYIRDGESTCSVQLRFDTEDVTWRRAPTAEYELQLLPEGEKTRFTAVGRSAVPDLINAALNVDTTRQVVDQFDGPFLLSLTPSRAAAELSALSKANVLGEAIAFSRSQARQRVANADAARHAQVAAANHLDSLAWVEAFLPGWLELQATARDLQTAQKAHADALALVAQARVCNDIATRFKSRHTAVHASVLRLETQITVLEAQKVVIDACTALVARYHFLANIGRVHAEAEERALEAQQAWDLAVEHADACPTCERPFK